MNMKKLLAALLACAMMAGVLSACGAAEEPKGDANPGGASVENESNDRTEPYRLGYINMSGYGATFEAITTVLESMCDAAGVELVPVQMAGGGADGFITAYENLVNMGIDGVMASSSSEGQVRLIAELFEQNDVDWFLVNRRLSDSDLQEYVFSQSRLVGNEFCYEEETAYQVVKQLHEEYGMKNLAVIGLTLGDAAGDLRDQGIAKACEEFGVTLLTETRGISSASDVTNAVEGIITSYPEVDGFFIVGGSVTNGALAGASQALANHGMEDKVVIGMIDIASGMEEYMGEGKPLKVVAGGNLLMDWVISCSCMINYANGIDTDKTPYILNTSVMYVKTPEDAVDYSTYYENPTIPMMSGDQWYDTLLGKDVDTIQAFVDNYTLDYARSLSE